jgi:cytochrome c peroxidase
MANTWERAAASLAGAQAYPGLTAQSMREALAFYCLSLVTPNARFDRYLRGTLQLTAAEHAGYDLFRTYGCVSCHQGINIGGNLLQRFGVMRDYFAERVRGTPADDGLFNATQRPEDRHVFRVPSLRNVALTAPYFHDGSVPTLEGAIETMALFQLGRSLSEGQIDQIAAFLRSLTGELDGRPL